MALHLPKRWYVVSSSSPHLILTSVIAGFKCLAGTNLVMGLGDGSLKWGPGTEPLVGIRGQSPGMVLAVSVDLGFISIRWYCIIDRGIGNFAIIAVPRDCTILYTCHMCTARQARSFDWCRLKAPE